MKLKYKLLLLIIPLLALSSTVYGAFPYSMTYTVSAGDTILADHLNQSNSEHINNNIPESIDDYSATNAEMGSTTDPYPASIESKATTLDGELQRKRFQINSLIDRFNTDATKWYHDVTNENVLMVKGADVAATAALPVIADGGRVDVTGTATITSIASVGTGTIKTLQFDTAGTILTHNATTLNLGGSNITVASGDIATIHEYDDGNWELLSYSGFLTDIVNDTTPQLGGNLDLNGSSITSPDGTDTLSISSGTMTITTASTNRIVIDDNKINFSDNTVERPTFRDYSEIVNTVSAAGATETLDMEVANVHDITLDEALTLTFSNAATIGTLTSFTLIHRQDGAGGNATVWPAEVDWGSTGTAPTLDTSANIVNIFGFITINGGTVWHGFTGSLDSQ